MSVLLKPCLLLKHVAYLWNAICFNFYLFDLLSPLNNFAHKIHNDANCYHLWLYIWFYILKEQRSNAFYNVFSSVCNVVGRLMRKWLTKLAIHDMYSNMLKFLFIRRQKIFIWIIKSAWWISCIKLTRLTHSLNFLLKNHILNTMFLLMYMSFFLSCNSCRVDSLNLLWKISFMFVWCD